MKKEIFRPELYVYFMTGYIRSRWSTFVYLF